MRDDWIPETSFTYSEYLQDLHKKSGQNKSENKKRKSKRRSLSKTELNPDIDKTCSTTSHYMITMFGQNLELC